MWRRQRRKWTNSQSAMDERYQKALDRIRALEGTIEDQGKEIVRLREEVSDMDAVITDLRTRYENTDPIQLLNFVTSIASTQSKFAKDAKALLAQVGA